jgi:periplasmic divalent cation tolerance protein
MHMSQIIIYMTAPTDGEAHKIAEALVEQGLVACANIFPAHASVYRWQGKVERGQEVAVILKTTAERFTAVEAAIIALHSYDVPCIVSWPIMDGHAPFLDWVSGQVKHGIPGQGKLIPPL